MPFRHTISLALAIACSVLTGAALADTPAHDIPGGHDSPLISRFPGSTLIGYHAIDFDQAEFPMGKWDDAASKFVKTETVTGKVTDLAYVAPGGKSAFEVYHDYQSALAQAGFVAQYQCADDACGQRYDLSVYGIADDKMRSSTTAGHDSNYHNSMVDTLSCNGGDLYLTTEHLTRAQGNVDVSLMICGNSGKRVGVLLQIVEAKAMARNEMTVNAKAMGQGLAQNGHIALYGIQFASNSATLTPGSNATLAQMAALLKSQPALNVYIVGHTDDTGALPHNLTLSQQRADSVMKALEARGVAANRLAAKGLASYAPVASNDNDAGRAENRRVEMVKQ